MSVYTLSDLTNNNSDLLQGASKHSCPICSSRAQTSDSSAERSAAQASAFSNSNDIDALIRISRANPGQPAKWNVAPGGTITYSFVTAESSDSYFAYRDETNIEEVNDAIKQNVRQIFRDNYATVLPLNFVEVPDSAQSNIRIMFSDGPGADGYAYTYQPGILRGGAIHLQKLYENDPETAFSSGPGSYGHFTLIHEIGHAMGLKHPGNYSFGSDQIDNPGQPPYLPFDKDNTRNTIMSYNAAYSRFSDPNGENPRSLMAYDIRALQYLYGARSDFNGGNNVYRFDSSNFNTLQTIWDGGGSDTLDFSALPANNVYSLDLNQGKPLTAKSALGDLSYYLEISQVGLGTDLDRLYTTETFGTYIAFGADIENLVGSPGNDQVLGNELPNSILGSAGNDTISGGRQSDSLDGGEGGDYIYGDKGMDLLTGGGGGDFLRGGRGNDTIISGVGFDDIVLQPDGGTDTIVDFTPGVDWLVLVDGLRFEQLSIVPSGNDTEIRIGSTGQVLALLPGMALSSIGESDFLVV
ncbi:M10 family metallopeptidase [Microcoleus sp. AR_TQ3_B6]|uniref:M10 family metallopeptidase n=1 Tax=Microcoleus sp. AR_TQ3_B6 TaxID=3055284 RepID=UPI002FD47466